MVKTATEAASLGKHRLTRSSQQLWSSDAPGGSYEAPWGAGTQVRTWACLGPGPSPPWALLRGRLHSPPPPFYLHSAAPRGLGQILCALAPRWVTPLAIWYPCPHRSLLLALSP